MANLKERPLQVAVPGSVVRHLFPDTLFNLLVRVHAELGGAVYLSGGAPRDILLARKPADLDLTLPLGSRLWAKRLAELGHGTCITLGRQKDTTRVVIDGQIMDLSNFREDVHTIEGELLLRDLRVNAMALRVDPLFSGKGETNILSMIDPGGGCGDLADRELRALSADNFRADPLRLLRVFRFAAELNFAVAEETLEIVTRQRVLIRQAAPERQAHELALIMATPKAHATLAAMASCDLLWELLPELAEGRGVRQPQSHHLDVWHHSLEALRQMERILAAPAAFFPDCPELLDFAAAPGQAMLLKWAALMHDLGKPATFAVSEAKGGKITFYNHDSVGAELFRTATERLRWSNRDTETVARLIDLHMHIFQLANLAREGNLTLRARIRLIRRAGDLLPALFLLAMADALAGLGEAHIPEMEAELVALCRDLTKVQLVHVEPVRQSQGLLNGRDLIDELGLAPGPAFRRILDGLEEAQMEGHVTSRAQALHLARILAAEPGASACNTTNNMTTAARQ